MSKKRRNYRWCLPLLAAAILAGGCDRIGNTDSSETDLAEGVRKASVRVVSITGNELTYIELETEAPETESEAAETEKETAGAESETVGTESETAGAENETTGTESETAGAENETEETADAQSKDSASDGKRMGGGQKGNWGDSSEMPTAAEGSSDANMPAGGMTPPSGTDGNQMMPSGDGTDSTVDDNGSQMMTPPSGMDGNQMMPSGDGTDSTADDSGSQMMTPPSGTDGNQMMPSGDGTDSTADNSEAAAVASLGEGRSGWMETTTVYLPVGVPVYSGSKTATFSILQAGDELEVQFETDENGTEVITKIWITGTT